MMHFDQESGRGGTKRSATVRPSSLPVHFPPNSGHNITRGCHCVDCIQHDGRSSKPVSVLIQQSFFLKGNFIIIFHSLLLSSCRGAVQTLKSLSGLCLTKTPELVSFICLFVLFAVFLIKHCNLDVILILIVYVFFICYVVIGLSVNSLSQ